jgi:hypothetical protein
MALTCDPRIRERKQEDHEFETRLGYTVRFYGRKEGRKEGMKEGRKEGGRKGRTGEGRREGGKDLGGRNYLSFLASLLMLKLQNLSKESSFSNIPFQEM